MRLGQLQWALFWIGVVDSKFIVVWLLSLFFTDYGEALNEKED